MYRSSELYFLGLNLFLDKFDKIPIKPYEELGDTDYAEIFINISDDVFYHSTRECYYGYNSVKSTWEEKKKEFMFSAP